MKMNGFNDFLPSRHFFHHPSGQFQRHFHLTKQGGRVRQRRGASGAPPSSGALPQVPAATKHGNRTLIGWCVLIPEFSRPGEPDIESEYYVRFTRAAKLRYQYTPANLLAAVPQRDCRTVSGSWEPLGRARFGAGGLVSQVRFRGGRGCADGSAPQVIEHPPPEFDSRCSL